MRLVVSLVVFLLALTGPALTQEPRAVVQAFYDAYLVKDLVKGPMNRVEFVTEQKASLEPEFAALLLDICDNDRTKDEAWLDFDPFINGQMNAATITVGSATVANGLASVPVEVSYRGPGHDVPAVKVILRPSGGTWRIANFIYPPRHGAQAWDLKSWLQRELGK